MKFLPRVEGDLKQWTQSEEDFVLLEWRQISEMVELVGLWRMCAVLGHSKKYL